MQVNLTYFKRSGKYYSTGCYHDVENKGLSDIWQEVKNRRDAGLLPGLSSGDHSEFIVLIDVPDHPHNHPRLLVMRKYIGEVANGENWGRAHRIIVVEADNREEALKKIRELKNPDESIYQVSTPREGCELPQPVWDFFNGGEIYEDD